MKAKAGRKGESLRPSWGLWPERSGEEHESPPSDTVHTDPSTDRQASSWVEAKEILMQGDADRDSHCTVVSSDGVGGMRRMRAFLLTQICRFCHGDAADRGHRLEADRGTWVALNTMPREQSEKQNKTDNHVYNLKTQVDKRHTLCKNTV